MGWTRLAIATLIASVTGCGLFTSLDGLTETVAPADGSAVGDADIGRDVATPGDDGPVGRFTLTMTVVSSGGGAGSVVSAPEGIACGANCAAAFDAGTLVKLTATPALGSFVAWSGDCIGAGTECSVSMTGARNVTATFTPANYMFVTSLTYQPGALGGLAGADAKCREAAQDAALTGTYVAWLSTANPNVSAASRLGSRRGWMRRDGKPFADSVASLTSGRILYPPRIDEAGRDVGDVLVATGTRSDGTVQGVNTAGDWTTNTAFSAGYAAAGAGAWTDAAGTTGARHLYCFGIDFDNPVTIPKAGAGRIAFISRNKLTPATGIGAADALCGDEARSALLPGTYKALLATTTTGASARFSLTGPTWVRPDGVLVVATPADLPVPKLLAPIDVQADGTYVGLGGVWSGAFAPSTAGAALDTCNDWAPGDAGTPTGVVGASALSTPKFFSWFTSACSTPMNVYCLQE